MRSFLSPRSKIFLGLIFLACLSLGLHSGVAQQISSGVLTYGETVSGIFDETHQDAQIWTFDAKAREMLTIHVQRIGGRLTPRLTLMTPNGTEVSPSATVFEDADRQKLVFSEGLPDSGSYQIKITGTPNTRETAVENPNEYSLTLTYEGIHHSEPNEGLDPVPGLDINLPVSLTDGRSQMPDGLSLLIYGDGVSVTQPDARGQRNRYVIKRDSFSVDLDNATPLNKGLQALIMNAEGTGFITLNGMTFFADQSMTALKYDRGLTIVTLANGQTFRLDGYRIISVQVRGGLVVVITTTQQRLIFEGSMFEFKQRDGLSTSKTAEQINEFIVDQKPILASDMIGWETAHLSGSGLLRLYRGLDIRIIADALPLELLQRGNSVSPELDLPGTDTRYVDLCVEAFCADTRRPPTTIAIDPFGMGDINVQNGTIHIQGLNGRSSEEPLNTSKSILIEDRAVLYRRQNGSSRLVLPDSTDIETSAKPSTNTTVLPNSADFVPRAFNNLGHTIFDYHPRVALDEAVMPYNIINGNFNYSVTDLALPSHTLILNWTRQYNSLSPDVITPAYMRSVGYIFGQMGAKWRHSYQYDLDITYALMGQVQIILPDGSRHIFIQNDASIPVYRSTTLLSWEIERVIGTTGAWRARTTEGLVYEFDRAGRLEHITNAQGAVLLFSRAPRGAVSAQGEDITNGFFVTEFYGRRIEAYMNAEDRIVLIRQQSTLRYQYDEMGRLDNVEYPSVEERYEDGQQTYTYNAAGQLVETNDWNSLYHPELGLAYDDTGRLIEYILNRNARDDAPALVTTITYEGDVKNGTVTLSRSVNGQPQNTIWRHENYRPIEKTIGTDPVIWRYRYEYDGTTGQFRRFVNPNGVGLTLRFDEWGYVINAADPAGSAYGFIYEKAPDGVTQLLKRITAPSTPSSILDEVFDYDEHQRLIKRSVPFGLKAGTKDPDKVMTIRYDYDELGQIKHLYQPNPDNQGGEVVTEYAYDDFGYLTHIIRYPDQAPETAIQLQLHFDSSGRLTEVTDWRGQPVTLEWDNERQLLLRLTYGDSSTGGTYGLQFRYNAYGLLTGRDTQNQSEAFVYDGLYRLVSTRDGLGRLTTYRYDEIGNLLEQVEPDPDQTDLTPNLQITRYTYDALNHLTQVDMPGGITMKYVTTMEQNKTSWQMTLPTGEQYTYLYNVSGQVQEVIRYDLRGTDYPIGDYALTYDPRGQLVSIAEKHDSVGRTLKLTYDNLGHPITTQIDSSTMTYDYNTAGLLAAVVDADSSATRYSYDAWGNIVQVNRPVSDMESNTLSNYQYTYDEAGNLTSVTDPLNAQTRYTYDTLGRLETVIDSLDHETRYTYDDRDNLISLTDARGSQSQAFYNAADELDKWVDATGAATTYAYDQLDRLIGVVTTSGTRIGFTYDAQSHIVAQNVTDSRQYLYAYDILGRLTSQTNALGQTFAYNYNNIGRISQILDPLGNLSQYLWYGNGRINGYIDPLNRRFTYTSDRIGRVQQVTFPNQERYFINYNDVGEIESIELRGTKTWSYDYTYTPSGQVASFVAPEMEGAGWRFGYDSRGQLTHLTTPDDKTTLYSYDSLGRITQIDYPDKTQELYSYDEVGNIICYVAPDGTASQFSYDAVNRMTARLDWYNSEPMTSTESCAPTDTSIQRETLYSYSSRAPQFTIIDPQQNETRYYYDAFGNLIRVERSLTSPITPDTEIKPIEYRYAYDRANNLIEITQPAYNEDDAKPIINFTYNVLNQRVRYVDAINASWAYRYDPLGNLLQFSDPLGNTVEYKYDVSNRISTMTSSNGAYAEFRYNATQLDVPETRDLDQSNRLPIYYRFDINGRLLEIEQVNSGGKTQFGRDSMGRVTEIKTATGKTIGYTYDMRGRVDSVTTQEGRMDYDYTARGQLKTLSSDHSSATFEYDGFGALTGFTQDGAAFTYERDTQGHLLRQSSANYGTLSYTYDTLYRPITLTEGDHKAVLTYNDIGWLTAITYSNGLVVNYEYLANGRIQQVIYQSQDNSALIRFGYEYDDAGNMVRVTRNDLIQGINHSRVTLYSYNTANELIGERWLNENNEVVYSVTYRYDTAGNRIDSLVTQNGRTPQRTVYEFSRNLLTHEFQNTPPDIINRLTGDVTTDTSASFAIGYDYDKNGSLIESLHEKQSLKYEYDSFNRLSSVKGTTAEGIAIKTQYTYDSLGRLAVLQTNAGKYTLVYDAERLVAIRDETNNVLERYIYSPQGRLLWVDTAEGRRYPLLDALSTVRGWLDEQGHPLNNTFGFNLNAFGNIIFPYGTAQAAPIPSQPQPLFAGQLYDSSTGLYLMGVRAYLPSLGRFIQRDPVRHDPQSSLYAYAYNRPTYYTDPSGTTPRDIGNGLDAVLWPQADIRFPLPTSLLPAQTALPDVKGVQLSEHERMLEVSAFTQYIMNTRLWTLDPSLCDGYFDIAKSLPDTLRSSDKTKVFGWLSLYSPEQGWLPQTIAATRQKSQRENVFTDLDQWRAYADTTYQPFSTSCPSDWALPQVPLPTTMLTAKQHQALWSQLQEIPMFPSVGSILPLLTEAEPTTMQITPPQIGTTQISESVVPSLPVPLVDLAAQTQDLTYQTLIPAPLPFATTLQTGTQAVDNPPPLPNIHP